MPSPGPALILRLFLPFMLGYFLSYLFRSINNVIAPDLVRDVGLDAAGLGLLTGAYLIAFAAFQLPLGILLDRFGPRRTEAALLLVAALGAYIFAVAETTVTLIAGRALIGLGVSACLMAAFKAFVDWLPRERLPVANGIIFATGGLGMMGATIPVETALQFTDWRGVFLGLAAAGVVAAALIMFVVPERPKSDTAGPPATLARQINEMWAIFQSRTFLGIAPLAVATQGSAIAIMGLWSGPWLRDVAGWDRPAVANGLFWIAAAVTASYLVTGFIASRVSRAGGDARTVSVAGMGIFLVVQLMVILEAGPPALLWILYPIFGTAGGVIYASLSHGFAPHLAGRVNTALNLLVFVSAFAVQWGVGAIINLWPVRAGGGFATDGYAWAFGAVLAFQGAAFAWFALCRLRWPAETAPGKAQPSNTGP